MQTSRVSSRAIKQLAASKQTRGLHVIGPAKITQLPPKPTYQIRERVAAPSSAELPQSVAGLRAECQNRKLPTTGSKAELMDRLTAHKTTRAYSTAVQGSRNFSMTNSTKKSGDQCSFNFAFLPEFDPSIKVATTMPVLPVMPGTVAFESSEIEEIEAATHEILPSIYTVTHESTHIQPPSAMVDVSDIAPVDFHGLAAKVVSKIAKPVEEGVGMSRQLWNGLVDDILGPKGPAVSRG